MNIKQLQARLLPFQGLRNEHDDGDDLGGEVINAEAPEAGSDNGWNSAPSADEDRGDNLEPATATPAATSPAPAETSTEQGAEQEPEDTKAHQTIPKARFNEVNEARKEAEREAEALRQELEALRQQRAPAQSPTAAPAEAPAEPFNIEAAEQRFIDLLMEGETAEAAKLRTQINAELTNRAAAYAIEQQNAETARKQAQAEMVDVQAVASQAVVDYPYLETPEGADVLAMIKAARDASIAKGTKPSVALKQAVDRIAPKFAPEGSEIPVKGFTGDKPTVDTRNQNAIARGVKAAEAQAPAVQAGIGNRATTGTVDVANMTDEQFDALSPAEKAKLRGDTF